MFVSAQKVASRYKFALLNLKQTFRDFLRKKAEIDNLLRDEKVTEAKQQFIELGNDLAPLTQILKGLVITRPDEQRKLKNVKQWLHRLTYPFDPKHLYDEGLSYWIPNTLETVEEALKSLIRVQDRLYGYSSIEKEFQHGPFRVINKYGYKPEEYAEPIKILDAASDAIQKKGLGKVLYGAIHLAVYRGQGSGGIAGVYHVEDDSVILNMISTHRYSDIYTLIHEFGHRMWHKELSAAQRDTYKESYLTGTTKFSLEDREDMFQALVKANFVSIRRAVHYLKNSKLAEGFPLYWKEHRESFYNLQTMAKDYARGETFVYKNFVHPKATWWLLETGVKPQSVTDYGQTKVTEDYAETFAFYVLGWKIQSQILERFKLTID